MDHTSRQDTKIMLGQLAPQMKAIEAAYMRDDNGPLIALLAELPGNEMIEAWAANLQRKRAGVRFIAWLTSGSTDAWSGR